MGRVQNALERIGRAPGVAQWRRRRFERRFVAGEVAGCCTGVYASYAEAAAAAPTTRPLGYDHPDAAAMYRDRLNRVYPSDYAMMVWLQKALADGVRKVVDFGGHIGLTYYAYDHLLGLPADVSWRVCDVPAVVAAGREEALARDPSGRLGFTDQFSEVADADLLFTAGCVQFIDDSLIDRLARLEKRPRWLLVNLLPLSDKPDYWTVMSIGTAFCPYRIQQRRAFFESLERLGYQLLDSWENLDKDCWIAFEPEHSLDRYWGAALKLA